MRWRSKLAVVRRYKTKVFGIGFHKTGTTSLAVALRTLGYRVTGPNGVDDPDIAVNALPLAMSLVPRFDAFQDNPWPILFRDLDQRYPGSRFILTTRDPDRWVRSQVKHFGSTSTPMREWIYGVGAGSPQGNEQRYVDRFLAHNDEVRRHFAQRPGDLLELDIEAGAGWTDLCRFLDLPVPYRPFPHANTAEARAVRRKAPPT